MSEAPTPPYLHLRVHSAYSLAEGAIPIAAMTSFCKAQNQPAIAITDSMNLFGAMEFSLKASAAGIQPIIGVTAKLPSFHSSKSPQDDLFDLVILVINETGYQNISALISRAYIGWDDDNAPVTPRLEWSWLTSESCAGLICLTGGNHGVLSPYAGADIDKDKAHAGAKEIVQHLQAAFAGRLYLELNRLTGNAHEQALEALILELADQFQLPLVASNDCYFLNADGHEAHDALLCIAQGSYVNSAERRRVGMEHWLKPPDLMASLFADLPEALDSTIEIAKRCAFWLTPSQPLLPPFPDCEGLSEADFLVKQAKQRLETRLNAIKKRDAMDKAERAAFDKIYHDRLKTELDVINGAGFAGYFLIVSDFISWAKQSDIPVGPGRGSGAGSLVAYALEITNIDPIEWDLLFERFLNPERVSLPDFDIDFCPDRRDLVIDYVCGRYGAPQVAQIITFGTLQARAALRDVGRVLQMPYGQVDRICKLTPNNPANPINLTQAIEQEPQLQAEIDRQPEVKKLFDIALQLEGLYRHASTHAAGVVIADRPLQQVVPLYRDPRAKLPTTQFSKNYAEAAGLVKYDFLGLKTLTIIDDALKLVEEFWPGNPKINLDQIDLDDGPSFTLFQEANTHGVFQLESAGMRQWLKQLRPEHINDIVAMVALYRPGPMEQIPTYVACRWGRQEIQYAHPKVEPIFKPTYGVAVYQEQVMMMARVLAGYSLGKADDLRSAIGKKNKEKMAKHRISFIAGAKEFSDIDEDEAEKLFAVIQKFAGYGFNKSHAVAYAVVAYHTAYLKANYAEAFFVGAMEQERKTGNTDALAGYVADARKQGINVLPPDINHPYVKFTLEPLDKDNDKSDKQADYLFAIRYGLGAIKNVGELPIRAIEAAFDAGGPFTDIFNFLERVDGKAINKRLLETLIKAGVFDSLEPNRNLLLTHIELLVRHMGAAASDGGLFGMDLTKDNRPQLTPVPTWDEVEKLAEEAAAIGFYLSGHPLEGFATQLERLKIVPASDLLQGRIRSYERGTILQMAGILMSVRYRNLEFPDRDTGEPRKVRMAVLNMTDTSGAYEATLYDRMIDELRPKLEAGNLLLLSVSARTQVTAAQTTDNNAPAASSPASSPAPTQKAGESDEVRVRLRVLNIEDLRHACAQVSEMLELTLSENAVDYEALGKAFEAPQEVTSTNGKSGGKSAVFITQKLGHGKMVEGRLNGFYHISPDFQNRLRAIRGVESLTIT